MFEECKFDKMIILYEYENLIHIILQSCVHCRNVLFDCDSSVLATEWHCFWKRNHLTSRVKCWWCCLIDSTFIDYLIMRSTTTVTILCCKTLNSVDRGDGKLIGRQESLTSNSASSRQDTLWDTIEKKHRLLHCFNS